MIEDEISPNPESGARSNADGSARVGSSALLVFGSAAFVQAAMAFTGIWTGRALGPEGKGQVAAVTALVLTLTWVGALGSRDAIAYLMARRPLDKRAIRSTAVIATAVLACLWFAIAQLALPALFAAQDSSVVTLARFGLLWIFVQFELEATLALLRGGQHFRDAVVAQVAQPLALIAALVVLWLTDSFTVNWVMASLAIAAAVACCFGFWRLHRTSGFGAPTINLAREGADYSKRAFVGSLGGLVNARLDLTILPAVVAATQIGLYSVATNAAAMIAVSFGSLGYVVLPVAARRGGQEGMFVVERLVRFALYGSLVVAAVLAVFGEQLITTLYGDAFAPAITPLRILLPGIVLWAAASLLCAGLQSIGRPGLASWAQFVGVVITVVGLAITLSPLGINGAALTSTVAYSACFVAALLFIHQSEFFSARRTFSLRLLLHDARQLLVVARTRRWPEVAQT